MKITKAQACIAAAAVFNPGVALVAVGAYLHAKDNQEKVADTAKKLIKENEDTLNSVTTRFKAWLKED